MHLDEEVIQRLVDRELPAAAAQEHLAQCEACRVRLGAAEREAGWFDAKLREIDHLPPAIRAADVIPKAASQARSQSLGRLAASVVLALSIAGVAYAIPGSPLRGLVQSLLGRAPAVAPAPVAPPVNAPPPAPVLGGIAVEAGASLVVEFSAAQSSGLVRINFTEGSEVSVRAPDGVARYTSAGSRLLIANDGSIADFEIEIPKGARRVEIRVGGSRRLLKEGKVVTVGTRVAQLGSGPYILELGLTGR